MNTHLQSLVMALAASVMILNTSGALAQNLDLDDQTACEAGQAVVFTVSLNNAPTEVDAFAFDISFDDTILSFDETDADNDLVPESITRGSLVQNWSFFGASKPNSSARIGGSTVTNIISAGTSGELLRITFQVLQLQATTLTITNAVDDVAAAGWTLGSGQLLIGGSGDCNVCDYDVDGNSVSDALTDGLLILRFLFGFRGDTLINGVVAPDCSRCSASDIETDLTALQNGGKLDVDGNSVSDALTDGLLILRFLFGFRGDTLINGVVAPDCTRCSASDIEAFLNPKTCS